VTKPRATGAAIPPERTVTLTPDRDGVLHARWPRRRVRFLLSDGRTVDVITERDDSDLRAALLHHTKAERIEGSTVVATLADTEGGGAGARPEDDDAHPL
jgi:hypothetical protein